MRPERVAWCIFHRKQDAWLGRFRKQEQAVRDTLDALAAEIATGRPAPCQAPVGRARSIGGSRPTRSTRLFGHGRVRVPDVDGGPAGGEAQGISGSSSVGRPVKKEPIDWAPCEDPLNNAPGSLEDWLQIAQRDGLGLMLYLLDPLEQARLKEIETGTFQLVQSRVRGEDR